jgi:uncharacterized protein
MPLYVIHALDHAGKLPVRLENYLAHRIYLGGAEAMGIRIHASGPLVSEDGATMIGSLFVIEATDEAAARAFNAGDPFAAAGLWQQVNIQRFDLKRGAVGVPQAGV